MGIVAPYRWLDSVKSAAETRLWVVDGIANGLRPWFNQVLRQRPRQARLKVVEDLYQWHYRCGALSAERGADGARGDGVLPADGGILRRRHGLARKWKIHRLGMYQALIDARMPFEMVHDGQLDAAHIGRFKLLLLPNIAALSDGQCEQLREFVRGGGSLLATYETSLYDEWGERRADFGLADLFGASFEALREGPIQNSYFHVERTLRMERPIRSCEGWRTRNT